MAYAATRTSLPAASRPRFVLSTYDTIPFANAERGQPGLTRTIRRALTIEVKSPPKLASTEVRETRSRRGVTRAAQPRLASSARLEDDRHLLTPLHYAARRLLRRPIPSLRDVARRTWILHPSERETRPPALCLPGQLDRVEAVQQETTLDAERRRVLGGPVEHAAITMFELAGAEIAEGSIYASGCRISMLPGSVVRAALASADEELERAAIDCTYVGNKYFGHWLTDDCTLHFLMREHADPIGLARTPYPHEAGYCRAWDMQHRKVSRVRVRSLLLGEDYGQNANKRDRYRRLRATLLRHAGPERRAGIYLRRGSSGVLRLLVNEDEVEATLARRGFAVVDPTAVSVAELVRSCAGAACVVAVEGSSMAHGVMTVRDGGSLVTLQPPWRFNSVFKDYTDCLDMRYAFLVGSRSGEGFRIDVDELERTLDLCLRD